MFYHMSSSFFFIFYLLFTSFWLKKPFLFFYPQDGPVQVAVTSLHRKVTVTVKITVHEVPEGEGCRIVKVWILIRVAYGRVRSTWEYKYLSTLYGNVMWQFSCIIFLSYIFVIIFLILSKRSQLMLPISSLLRIRLACK